MTEAQAIALAGGIIGAVYGAVQMGDRLWLRPKQAAEREAINLPQSMNCRAEHEDLRRTLERLANAQANQATAMATLTTAITQLVADRHAEREVLRARHEELLRVIPKDAA